MQFVSYYKLKGYDLMFYKRFIQLCEINNEKPTNVLKSIGVSSGNLQNCKNGTSIKSDILMQLSEHFNVSTDYLLGRTDEPKGTNIKTGDNKGDNNNSSVNIGSKPNKFDKTTTQVAEIFQDLDVLDKAKVLNLIAELSEKKEA